MGGPCWLIRPENDNSYGLATSRLQAPACTDNFQIITFTYQGQEWQSVEQCYQASKFNDNKAREQMRLELPQDEDSRVYGMHVWRLGNNMGSPVRPDWDKVKVDLMFDICWAKYASNPNLQRDLLQTGDCTIEGSASTGWVHPVLGSQNWSYWNGIIQMRCRAMLQLGQQQQDDDKGSSSEASLILSELASKFDEYRDGYS
jgi:ribA/ribD-fused uncharacterized protein